MLKRAAIILLCLTISFVVSSAQSEGTFIEGVIVYYATGGSIEENDDGTFEIILEGVSNSAPYWLSEPMFMPLPPELIGSTPVSDMSSVGNLLVASTVNAWQMDVGLTGIGWISTRDSNIEFILSNPDYIPTDGRLIFTGDLVEVIGEEDAKGNVEVPESFRNAVLMITFDTELLMGLDIGIANAIGAVRWTCSGTERQYAICECKRAIDRETEDRDVRVAGYEECNNAMPGSGGGDGKK